MKEELRTQGTCSTLGGMDGWKAKNYVNICFCHGLKLCMWFGYYPEIIFCHFFCEHGLKICMWFGYNPQIIFYHFFRKLNVAIFLAFFTIKVNG